MTNLVIPQDSHPNAIGEYLRDIFFDQSSGGYGAYTTFDVREGVTNLPSEPVMYFDGTEEIQDEDHAWTVYEYDGIRMRYYWDGDGTLEFHLPDGRILFNDDCKKSHNWEWE